MAELVLGVGTIQPPAIERTFPNQLYPANAPNAVTPSPRSSQYGEVAAVNPASSALAVVAPTALPANAAATLQVSTASAADRRSPPPRFAAPRRFTPCIL